MPAEPREFWKVAASFPVNKEEVYLDHAVAQEFDRHAGKTVLEYGAGGGSDVLSYLRRGCAVFYADIVTSNLTETMQRVHAAGYTSVKGRPWAQPFALQHSDDLKALKDGSIDHVNSHGCLHHIADDDMRLRVLREFHRVLKPGGTLTVMLYTEHLWERFELAIGKLVMEHGLSETEAFGWCTDGEGCPFALAYDEQSGRELLAEAHFKVETTYLYNNDDFRTFRAVKVPFTTDKV